MQIRSKIKTKLYQLSIRCKSSVTYFLIYFLFVFDNILYSNRNSIKAVIKNNNLKTGLLVKLVKIRFEYVDSNFFIYSDKL